MSTDALKYDDGKQLDHLSPPLTKTMMVNALKYGLSKYFKNSWRAGFKVSRMYDACCHHIDAFFHERQDLDPESGVHHLDLALFNVVMMRYSVDIEGKDDRPPVTPEQIAEVIKKGLEDLQNERARAAVSESAVRQDIEISAGGVACAPFTRTGTGHVFQSGRGGITDRRGRVRRDPSDDL